MSSVLCKCLLGFRCHFLCLCFQHFGGGSSICRGWEAEVVGLSPGANKTWRCSGWCVLRAPLRYPWATIHCLSLIPNPIRITTTCQTVSSKISTSDTVMWKDYNPIWIPVWRKKGVGLWAGSHNAVCQDHEKLRWQNMLRMAKGDFCLLTTHPFSQISLFGWDQDQGFTESWSLMEKNREDYKQRGKVVSCCHWHCSIIFPGEINSMQTLLTTDSVT